MGLDSPGPPPPPPPPLTSFAGVRSRTSMCPFLTRRQTDLITLMFGTSEFMPKMPSELFSSLWIQTDEQSGLWDARRGERLRPSIARSKNRRAIINKLIIDNVDTVC